jgi:hypothetical protein
MKGLAQHTVLDNFPFNRSFCINQDFLPEIFRHRAQRTDRYIFFFENIVVIETAILVHDDFADPASVPLPASSAPVRAFSR